jgi:hypothetical protein
MTMFKRIGRLFTIKTRWEAWAVIWAITLGAVERGKAYMLVYPGVTGWLFFAACVAVVFIAGPKLLDSVRFKAQPVTRTIAPRPVPERHPRLSRSRPRPSHRTAGSMSRTLSRRS